MSLSKLSRSPTDRPRSLQLCAWRKHLWRPGYIIKVFIMNGFRNRPNSIFMGMLQKGIDVWSRAGNIFFTFVNTAEKSDIRIKFTSDPQISSVSVIGKLALFEPKDQPTMTLSIPPGTSQRDADFTILHELGHALGFLHEHSSPNCVIQWNKRRVRCAYAHVSYEELVINIFRREDPVDTDASPFDPESVMMYGVAAELMVGATRDIPQPTRLSTTDHEWMLRFYPYPKEVSSPKRKSKKAGTRRNRRSRSRGQGTRKL
jgi:hypothetical protein